ncbi:MAG TPA: hypothetical protein VGG61_04390, partial [Gemmataceae bacterium]
PASEQLLGVDRDRDTAVRRIRVAAGPLPSKDQETRIDVRVTSKQSPKLGRQTWRSLRYFSSILSWAEVVAMSTLR